MAKPVVSIDANGISAPTYQDYFAWLQGQFRAIYGDDIYIEPDSQDGQLIGIFALACSDAAAECVQVYNALSPSTAQGAGLSRVVKINGLTRLAAAHSTADVTIAGDAGTVITNGVIADALGNSWSLPTSVTIPAGGSITVTATAQKSGPISASIGALNRIRTPVAGWASVTNAAAAVPGRDVETDAALRKRQAVSVAIPSRTVLEGILGAVAQIDGVTRLKGYENDTSSTDGNGIPGHSISVVVEGGDSATIAQTIAAKKTPGAGTYGGVSQTITDAYGISRVIRFGRPTSVTVQVKVSITALTGYTSAVGTEIKDAVTAAINDLAIGEKVMYTRLYAPALLTGKYASPSSPAHLTTYELTAVEIRKVGDAWAAADIVMAYNEVAVTDTSQITLAVS